MPATLPAIKQFVCQYRLDFMKTMRRIVFIVFAALASVQSPYAQDLHFVAPDSWSKQAVSPAALSSRVESAAAQYERNAPIPRIALFDIAYPANPAEYAELQ